MKRSRAKDNPDEDPRYDEGGTDASLTEPLSTEVMRVSMLSGFLIGGLGFLALVILSVAALCEMGAGDAGPLAAASVVPGRCKGNSRPWRLSSSSSSATRSSRCET